MNLNEALSKITHSMLPEVPLKVRVVTRDPRGNAMLAYREVDANYVGDTERHGQPGVVYVSIDEADIDEATMLDSYDKPRNLPRMSKFMELSTAHFTKNDAKLLIRGEAVVRLDRDEGCFLHVPNEEHGELAERLEAMRKAGYSSEIFNLVYMARTYGCDWILFDGDIDPTPGLPTFEW